MTTSSTCVPYKANQTGAQRAAHYIRKGKQMKLKNIISDAGMKRVAQQVKTAQEEADINRLVSEVSAALDYDIYAVSEFVVNLLTDVNAHPEARAVGDLLAQMSRV